ncbi:MAG: glycosyltransferase family 2 protein [Paludibacter sp.]|nr:glycosyltransferase family 2 protein [Paludibacter sp.]
MDNKISVIIPIYNSENFLRQTMNCVCCQTYKNLEIICVLDCPTDNSAEIVALIAKTDERIKTIVLPKNIGHANARNIGVKNASGEYIHFMDSDDFINPNFYEKMLEAIQIDDADIAACSVFYEKKPKRSIWFNKDEVLYGQEKIKKTKVTIQGWAWRYLIKKSFWIENNLSFPDLLLMVDNPVMIPMIYYANKVAFSSQAIYFYKNRENSVLNRKDLTANMIQERKVDRKKSRKMSKDFIRTHKVKGNSRLYYITDSLAGKKAVIENNHTNYGKIVNKISVIIPIYNAQKYLKQTLDAVRYQTYQHLEIICVLDCPTDNSAEIVKEISEGDYRFKIINHSKNLGLPAARNSGVKNATGEYIHFMDSDDLLNPEFYEILINAAVNSDADVTACSVFYEKKPKRGIWFRESKILSNTDDKIKDTEVAIQGWAWRYLIKKSFWNKNNFSFPDLVPMEDRPVMIPMIFYASKVALCPSAVYFYKNRENSILNKEYDPVIEKQRSENRRKSRKICRIFMKTNKIKRPNKLLYYFNKYFG